MDERCRDRAEYGQQRSFEPAADPGEIDENNREHHRRGLREHVTASHVGELMRDHGLELGGRQCAEQTGRQGDRGARGTAAGGQRPRKAVRDQVELRRDDPELGRERVDGRAQQRVLGERILPRAEHSEQRAVRVRVDRERCEQGAEDEHRRRLRGPAERAERGSTRNGNEEQRLRAIEAGARSHHAR